MKFRGLAIFLFVINFNTAGAMSTCGYRIQQFEDVIADWAFRPISDQRAANKIGPLCQLGCFQGCPQADSTVDHGSAVIKDVVERCLVSGKGCWEHLKKEFVFPQSVAETYWGNQGKIVAAIKGACLFGEARACHLHDQIQRTFRRWGLATPARDYFPFEILSTFFELGYKDEVAEVASARCQTRQQGFCLEYFPEVGGDFSLNVPYPYRENDLAMGRYLRDDFWKRCQKDSAPHYCGDLINLFWPVFGLEKSILVLDRLCQAGHPKACEVWAYLSSDPSNPGPAQAMFNQLCGVPYSAGSSALKDCQAKSALRAHALPTERLQNLRCKKDGELRIFSSQGYLGKMNCKNGHIDGVIQIELSNQDDRSFLPIFHGQARYSDGVFAERIKEAQNPMPVRYSHRPKPRASQNASECRETIDETPCSGDELSTFFQPKYQDLLKHRCEWPHSQNKIWSPTGYLHYEREISGEFVTLIEYRKGIRYKSVHCKGGQVFLVGIRETRPMGYLQQEKVRLPVKDGQIDGTFTFLSADIPTSFLQFNSGLMKGDVICMKKKSCQ